ncbi:MAG: helical backbone metal receptor [Hydrogenophaga sp.]|nr:helical backbone metal receptor [Hydrogenophaga sp.]
MAGLCALLLCAAVQAAGLQITDDRGVTVHLNAPPQRIVTLLPSLAETVCELGQCQRLVGVDRYTNWPAQIAHLPRLGGGLDPSVEAVLALRPDVVLLAQSARVIAQLEGLGLKVVALEPRTHADVSRVLQQVALLLGQAPPAAQAVWQRIDAEVTAVAQALPARAKGLRVYYEVNSGPYAAGPGSFIGETLSRLGAVNVVPAGLGPFPKLNPEFVVRANPDVIMVGALAAAEMNQRPGWPAMRAMREQRRCVFSTTESDVLMRAGPRLAEGARLMARCLQERAP